MPALSEISPLSSEHQQVQPQVQIIDTKLAQELSLQTLQAYAYTIYTPDNKPLLIPPASPAAIGQKLFFLLNRNQHQIHFGTKVPPNLQPYYHSENEVSPSLSSFRHVAGFFVMHEVLSHENGLPPVESAHLLNYDDWPQSGPILDFGSFTPNPTTSTYEKLFTLRELLSSSFNYAADKNAQDRMFVIMSARIRDFVSQAGIDFEVLGGSKSTDTEVQTMVYNKFPGYWNNDPLLCRFTSLNT